MGVVTTANSKSAGAFEGARGVHKGFAGSWRCDSKFPADALGPGSPEGAEGPQKSSSTSCRSTWVRGFSRSQRTAVRGRTRRAGWRQAAWGWVVVRGASVWYDKSMNSAKVALSLPAALLERAKAEVATGRAKNLSVFVAESLDQRLRRDELKAILDAMDEERGLPHKAAVAWAKRVLGS